jgi:peroxiredoxin
MSEPVETQEVGRVVANFQLPDVHGQPQSLGGCLDGKKGAVVVFWSGVCAHCVHYDPYLKAFESRHPQIALIAVASRSGETPEQIRATATERKLTFPILFDAGGALARLWFTQQTPRVFLLDAAIAEFLAGQPVSRKETASFGCAIRSVYYNIPVKL